MKKELDTITIKEAKKIIESKGRKIKLKDYPKIHLNNIAANVLRLYRFNFDSLYELKKYIEENDFKKNDVIYINDVIVKEVNENDNYYSCRVTLADSNYNDETLKVNAYKKRDELNRFDWKELIASKNNPHTRAQVWMMQVYKKYYGATKIFNIVGYSKHNDPMSKKEITPGTPPLSDKTIDYYVKKPTSEIFKKETISVN